jgi:predicted kinase
MKTLTLITGLPGSGKSTLANLICHAELERGDCVPEHIEADFFFTEHATGEYKFDASKLGEAHQWCKRAVGYAINADIDHIVVSNTFTQKWERQPYYDMARTHGYVVQVIEVHASFGSVHGVPADKLAAMAARYEPYKQGEELLDDIP